MDKREYEEQYRKAIADFKAASSDKEQWAARKAMAKLEQSAADKVGAMFADELHALSEELRRRI